MRNLLYLLILTFCNSALADTVLLQYESTTSREEIETTMKSFGLEVLGYWESIHGGYVSVPCGESERWVSVLSHVRGITTAEHNFTLSAGGNSPSYIPTCVPDTEAMYNSDSDVLIIPRANLDGEVYLVELLPPFNVRELQFLEKLNLLP